MKSKSAAKNSNKIRHEWVRGRARRQKMGQELSDQGSGEGEGQAAFKGGAAVRLQGLTALVTKRPLASVLSTTEASV